MKIVLKAMEDKRFKGDYSIQQACIIILTLLAQEDLLDFEVEVTNRNGIELILSALESFVNEILLQENAGSLLRLLCNRYEGLRKIVLESKAKSLIRKARDKFPESTVLLNLELELKNYDSVCLLM